MTLTVTGMPGFRVGRLICMDSTLTNITGTGIFQDQAHNFQDISSLSCWVGPVVSPHLSNKLERCLGCTARDVEIQSNLSERQFHCNMLPTTLQRRSAKCADLRHGSADTVIVLVFTNLN